MLRSSKACLKVVDLKRFEGWSGSLLGQRWVLQGLPYSQLECGRLLIRVVALSLVAIGVFALIQSASRHFLAHDLRYVGMGGVELCGIGQGRVACFMIHDRVSLGGALVAIGVLYLWLEQEPLKRGESWAWWTFLWAGIFGFGSFFAYQGYGYLDAWHGLASLSLLPLYLGGLTMTRAVLSGKRRPLGPLGSLKPAWQDRLVLGRLLLLMTSLGLIAGGTTIMAIGATWVFVPQDLRYLRLGASDLIAINRHLVPLIAHDRASFGGAVATAGVLLCCCILFGRTSCCLWRAISAAGGVGFFTAIIIHPIIGYTDFSHLAPAYAGAVAFCLGIALCHAPMCRSNLQRVTFREERTASLIVQATRCLAIHRESHEQVLSTGSDALLQPPSITAPGTPGRSLPG